MRIVAPNYTQIPNVIFDHWMHVLSHIEFKVLLAICRKTFGWHKDRDAISIKQIMEITGVNSRTNVCKALQKLEHENLIIKIKAKTEIGDDAPNKYEIHVHCLEGGSPTVGLPSPTVGLGGSPKLGPQVVLNQDQGVVLQQDSQKKENNTKENNTKPPNPQRVKSAKVDIDIDPHLLLHGKTLAQFVINRLCAHNSMYKPVEESIISKDLALILRDYKAMPKDVHNVVEWALNHHIWGPVLYKKRNVGKYLHEKFSQMFAQMNTKVANSQPQVDRRTRDINGNPVDSPADGRF